VKRAQRLGAPLGPLVHLLNLSSGLLYNKNAYLTLLSFSVTERPTGAGLFYSTAVTVSLRSTFPSMASSITATSLLQEHLKNSFIKFRNYNTSCQKVSTRTQKYEISWLNAEIIARRLGMR